MANAHAPARVSFVRRHAKLRPRYRRPRVQDFPGNPSRPSLRTLRPVRHDGWICVPNKQPYCASRASGRRRAGSALAGRTFCAPKRRACSARVSPPSPVATSRATRRRAALQLRQRRPATWKPRSAPATLPRSRGPRFRCRVWRGCRLLPPCPLPATRLPRRCVHRGNGMRAMDQGHDDAPCTRGRFQRCLKAVDRTRLACELQPQLGFPGAGGCKLSPSRGAQRAQDWSEPPTELSFFTPQGRKWLQSSRQFWQHSMRPEPAGPIDAHRHKPRPHREGGASIVTADIALHCATHIPYKFNCCWTPEPSLRGCRTKGHRSPHLDPPACGQRARGGPVRQRRVRAGTFGAIARRLVELPPPG
jgi:hypothetical protein